MIILGRHNLVYQCVRQSLTCLEMTCERVQKLRLERPVLHNLRRQFHEVAGNIRTRKR